MPTDVITAPAPVRVPRIAFPLVLLPFMIFVALAACRLAISLRYPEIAAAMADIVGP